MKDNEIVLYELRATGSGRRRSVSCLAQLTRCSIFIRLGSRRCVPPHSTAYLKGRSAGWSAGI